MLDISVPIFGVRLLCFSSAWMMSFSSCRVVSACSRALLRGASHIADRRVFVDARLEILKDSWVDACHCGRCGRVESR
jgi:hypothetical protein